MFTVLAKLLVDHRKYCKYTKRDARYCDCSCPGIMLSNCLFVPVRRWKLLKQSKKISRNSQNKLIDKKIIFNMVILRSCLACVYTLKQKDRFCMWGTIWNIFRLLFFFYVQVSYWTWLRDDTQVTKTAKFF